MPLKYENFVTAGESIRSYDHAGRTDCYIEGTVQGVNTTLDYAAYDVLVDKDVWKGEPHTGRVGKIVHVPMQVGEDDYDGRIVKIERPKDWPLGAVCTALSVMGGISKDLFTIEQRMMLAVIVKTLWNNTHENDPGFKGTMAQIFIQQVFILKDGTEGRDKPIPLDWMRDVCEVFDIGHAEQTAYYTRQREARIAEMRARHKPK
jgi:hypothetical protein